MLTLERCMFLAQGFTSQLSPTAYGSDIVSRYYRYVILLVLSSKANGVTHSAACGGFTSAQSYVADGEKKAALSVYRWIDNNYWYGVLAMGLFPSRHYGGSCAMRPKDIEGEYRMRQRRFVGGTPRRNNKPRIR